MDRRQFTGHLAAGAALWALLSFFGARWGVLVPLALYLTSAMTLPAMMWWTAALKDAREADLRQRAA